MPVFYAPPIQMSAILDPRLGRIRALQQVYSALQTDLPLLEERINLLRAVIIDREASSLAGSGVNPFLVQYRYDLGVALYERFLHVNEAGDLVQAEKHLKQALVGLPPKISPGPHSVLGSVLRERAFIASSCSLSDEALGLHRQTFITNADMCDLERARRHRELGLTLRIHFVNAGQTHCLMECIQQLKTSMSLFMRLGIFDHACSAALARAFTHLYDMETSKAHLSEASSISAAMLVQCPSDHRDFYRVVWSVAAVNRFLAWFCDDISLLNVDILRTALADAPSGWATLLTIELCEALRLPFVKQGSEEALSEAIAQVITLSESLDPEAAHWDGLQASLGNVLSLRFRMTGSADDIDNAAHATEMALARSDTRSPIHLSRLTRLALCRETQYRAFGDMAHLNDCIALHARITRLAPSDSAHRALAKHNLVDALKQRAEATGCLMDLDRAIELIPKSTTCLTFDHPNASTGLSQVGDVFLLRFERTGLLDDLERATTYYQQAARAWETSSSRGFEYHNVMNSYSKVLRIRYDVLHEVDSMTQALAQQKQLVDDLPVAHADRAHVLCGLAQTLICANRGHEDLEQGLKHLLDSLSNDYCPAYRRLKDAANVLTCLAKRGPQLNHVSNLKLSLVFSTTIALLPQVASFGLDPRARLAVISDSGQLTAQGASHAISINRHELALEMLEAGRSVFWAQGLRLRTSFTNLPSKIGDRLTALTSALNQPMADFGGEGPGKDRELARRRRLGDEFKAVVAEARLLPGMEDLLQNSSFASLARAAQQHPIVVFVASKNSGHAIIILKNAQCVHVNLEKAKGSTLKALVHHIEMHTRHARSSRGICIMQRTTPSATDVYRELWTTVMLPIVTALGWPKARGRNRPRLTLCPTGVFMQLPLHAAGIHAGENPVCCSDYFVSSYTPSIGALLHAQQTFRPVRRVAADTLIVAVENPFQGTALPMISTEASTISSFVSSSAKVVRVSRSAEVSERIQSASILHMACHGTQNLANALQSGFFLEDELLPVSKLMRLDLPQAFLAVLSACETAKGDATQPDQAIHLAATMLFCGFKSVVATMWFMRDFEGPKVAESIYSTLFKDGDGSEFLNPDDVPYALDEAVAKMRRSGLDPSFWATYVHIGM